MEIFGYILFGVSVLAFIVHFCTKSNIEHNRKILDNVKGNKKEEIETIKLIESDEKLCSITLVIAILCLIGGIACAIGSGVSSSSSNLSDEEKEWYQDNKETIDDALDAADKYKGY